MRSLTFPIVVAAALAVIGCIPSLQPLYTDSTTTFEPALVGVWEQENAESTWAFTRKEPNIYRLTYTDKQGKPGQFEARLVKLGDKYFLDLFPEEPQQVENAYYKFHLLRVHTFLKLSLDGSTLQLAGMDPNWLKRQLDADPTFVRHATVNNMIVLMASPEELQKFVRRHADDKDVFTAVIHLTRQDAAAAARAEVTDAAAQPEHEADVALFQFLIDNRNRIKRTVTKLPDGVETLTESDDPEITAKLQAHVQSMYQRVKNQQPIRLRDPLFVEIFRNADKIKMEEVKTKKGVKVIETSTDAYTVELIRAHAEVIDLFLKHGRAELRKNHEPPARK